MQGLGLMRRLTLEQYNFFGESLEKNMGRASPQDADVCAQRIFVLRHLIPPVDTPSSSESKEVPEDGMHVDETQLSNEYVFSRRSVLCSNTMHGLGSRSCVLLY